MFWKSEYLHDSLDSLMPIVYKATNYWGYVRLTADIRFVEKLWGVQNRLTFHNLFFFLNLFTFWRKYFVGPPPQIFLRDEPASWMWVVKTSERNNFCSWVWRLEIAKEWGDWYQPDSGCGSRFINRMYTGRDVNGFGLDLKC